MIFSQQLAESKIKSGIDLTDELESKAKQMSDTLTISLVYIEVRLFQVKTIQPSCNQ